MPQGIETSPEDRAKFRAHYLLSGNASHAGRQIGVCASTACDIANELLTEPGFLEDRKALRDRELEECIGARRLVRETAIKHATEAAADVYHLGESSTVIDNRAVWAKLLLEAEKNAHGLAKIEAGNTGEQKAATTVVNVHLKGIKADSDAGD
jgi:phage terminase small subunit